MYDMDEQIIKFKSNKLKNKRQDMVKLVDRFVYEFERCSLAHYKCDSYQFYVYYNLAFQAAVQLYFFVYGNGKLSYLPRNFSTDVLPRHEQENFYNLAGTLFLSSAHLQKRRLLSFFYQSLDQYPNLKKREKVKSFCEYIYQRDLLWNFRDIAFYNLKIKSGKFFRSSSLSFIQNEPNFKKLIDKKKISTVIDLRAEKEVIKNNYTSKSLTFLNLINASFDHYNLSTQFKKKFQHLTPVEMEYCFFTLKCKPAIKTAVLSIIQENRTIVVHCEAGKKRTGVFVCLLYLVSGADKKTI